MACSQREARTKCLFCQDIVENPKYLPCIHTFCLKCLKRNEKQQAEDLSKCPKCHQEFKMPEGGFEVLPSNAFTQQLLEEESFCKRISLDVKLFCDVCSSDVNKYSASDLNTATRYCYECNQFMCGPCHLAHTQITGTKLHVTQDIADIKNHHGQLPQFTFNRPVLCQLHQKNFLDLYCEDCSAVLCTKCVKIDHKNHEWVELEESSRKLSQQLNEKQDQLHNCINLIKHEAEVLESDMRKIIMFFSSARSQIELDYENKKRRLDERRQSCLEKLSQLETANAQEFYCASHCSKNILMITKDFQKYCEELISRGTPYVIARFFRDVCARANELMQKKHAKKDFSKVKMAALMEVVAYAKRDPGEIPGIDGVHLSQPLPGMKLPVFSACNASKLFNKNESYQMTNQRLIGYRRSCSLDCISTFFLSQRSILKLNNLEIDVETPAIQGQIDWKQMQTVSNIRETLLRTKRKSRIPVPLVRYSSARFHEILGKIVEDCCRCRKCRNNRCRRKSGCSRCHHVDSSREHENSQNAQKWKKCSGGKAPSPLHKSYSVQQFSSANSRCIESRPNLTEIVVAIDDQSDNSSTTTATTTATIRRGTTLSCSSSGSKQSSRASRQTMDRNKSLIDLHATTTVEQASGDSDISRQKRCASVDTTVEEAGIVGLHRKSSSILYQTSTGVLTSSVVEERLSLNQSAVSQNSSAFSDWLSSFSSSSSSHSLPSQLTSSCTFIDNTGRVSNNYNIESPGNFQVGDRCTMMSEATEIVNRGMPTSPDFDDDEMVFVGSSSDGTVEVLAENEQR